MSAAGGYASFCSGIEAVSEAWRDLPLGPVLLSEIEAFPIAVLKQRHSAACVRKSRPLGSVPLWGDFTTIRIRHLLRLGVDLESLEILIGGTPCQAFSMAGARRGLSDARGNLSLEYVRQANAIDNFRRHRGLQPIIIAWENVEGVLSMPDNAFGCFLAGLVGASAPLVPTGGARWSDAGLVVGPRRAAAWRLLDGQYFGLAQRRRRVLVVASARKACPSKILFESEGVRRDSPPRREPGKNVTGTLGTRASAGGGFGTDLELDGGLVEAAVTGALDTAGDKGGTGQDAFAGKLVAAFGGNRTSGALDIAAAVRSHGDSGRMDFEAETFIAHTLSAEGFDASEDGTGRGETLVPDVLAFDCKASGQNGFGIGEISSTLRAMGHKDSDQNAGGHAAVALSFRGRDGGVSAEIGGDTNPALRASQGGGDKAFVLMHTGVRRLTPREWERLQGFPDDATLIIWRGKAAPDGPRYRALGNSMPVPMIRWLGERISAALDDGEANG